MKDRDVDRDNISLLRRVQAELPRSRTTVTPPSEGRAAIEPPPPRESKKTSESRSHNVAISLIEEVSGVIPLLVEENETLRAVLKRDRERLEAEVEQATLIACKWRKSTEDIKLLAESFERKLAEMTERLHRAEAQLLSEKELAIKSARDAAEAECLSSLFEEKVMSSFGAGSPFQTTLDRIRQRAETDLV